VPCQTPKQVKLVILTFGVRLGVEEGVLDGMGVLLVGLLLDKEIIATVKIAMHKMTATTESVTLFISYVGVSSK
jgi:hypothetical protein